MAINTTPKEKAARGHHTTTATSVDTATSATSEHDEKAFSALRSAFALKGHTLHRSDPADGPATFWAERWGLLRHLPTIDTARQFLEQIGGRL